MPEEIIQENTVTPVEALIETAPNNSIVPETADGYIVPLSEEIPFSEKLDKSFKELALNLKLTTDQARAIGVWANETGLENLKNSKAVKEQFKEDSMRNLQTEWGINHEKNLNLAVRTAKSLAVKFPEFKDFLEETGTGNDPRFIKTLSKIGEMMSEDSLPYSSAKEGGSGYLGSMPVLNFSSMEK